MSIRGLLSAAASNYLSTLNKVDIFNDNSGKALYMFENNVLDQSGNYNGTATDITYGTGKFGQCAVFNGSTSKVTLTNPLGAAYSINWWVKSANTTRAVHVMLTCAGGNNATMVYYRTDNNTLEIGTNKIYTCSSSSGISNYYDANWHMLTLTCDGTTTKFYVDAVSVTLTTGVTLTPPTSLAVLGAYTSAGYNFNGSTDQKRVFNRALTAGEISTLHTEI